MRTQIAAANWKMNLTYQQGEKLLDDILAANIRLKDHQRTIFAVPFPFLTMTRSEVTEEKNYYAAAQNCHYKNSGAYTGEVSAPMLVDVGCTYVIVGHSERRQYFGETDETVGKKVAAALQGGLQPIVCIGESLAQRQAGETFRVLEQQVRHGLAACQSDTGSRIVLAYEPLWAIGTGVTATPSQAQEVHGYLRTLLTTLWGEPVARTIRIQYGGSVRPENIAALMAERDIDGALVGGASLEAHSFAQLLMYGRT